jgi:hypothetical protein
VTHSTSVNVVNELTEDKKNSSQDWEKGFNKKTLLLVMKIAAGCMKNY